MMKKFLSAVTPITGDWVVAFDLDDTLYKEADFVASARQSLADPDWFQKMRSGLGEAIRRCEFTNYCEALDQQHKQVTCKLWDRDALDAPDVTLASDGKRRLVAPRFPR